MSEIRIHREGFEEVSAAAKSRAETRLLSLRFRGHHSRLETVVLPAPRDAPSR